MWFTRPPLDVVESLTWIERKVSLSTGHGTAHGESVALAGGRGAAPRHGARAHAKEIRCPSDGEEQGVGGSRAAAVAHPRSRGCTTGIWSSRRTWGR